MQREAQSGPGRRLRVAMARGLRRQLRESFAILGQRAQHRFTGNVYVVHTQPSRSGGLLFVPQCMSWDSSFCRAHYLTRGQLVNHQWQLDVSRAEPSSREPFWPAAAASVRPWNCISPNYGTLRLRRSGRGTAHPVIRLSPRGWTGRRWPGRRGRCSCRCRTAWQECCSR